MKMTNFFYLVSILTIPFSASQQTLNSLIKQTSKLNMIIEKLEENVKKLSTYQGYKTEERKELIKELKLTDAEYSEEKVRFDLFGILTEETGLLYLKELRDALEKTDNPKPLFYQLNKYAESIEILNNNTQNRIDNVNRLITNIDALEKEYKPVYYKKLIYMLNQADSLIKKDKIFQNKVLILENDRRKSIISLKNLKNNNFFNEGNNYKVQPKCLNRNSCRVCLEDPNCIWCNLDKKCTLGDQNGPYDGSCVKSFNYSFCEKSCFNYTSCNTCLSNELCGWCGQLNKCVEGNIRNSIGMICDSGYIHKVNQGRCSNHFLHSNYNN